METDRACHVIKCAFLSVTSENMEAVVSDLVAPEDLLVCLRFIIVMI